MASRKGYTTKTMTKRFHSRETSIEMTEDDPKNKASNAAKEGRQLYWRVFRALFARVIFAVHALTAVWRVTAVRKGLILWILSVPTVLMFLEGAVRILVWNGRETRWFCVSVFLYLASAVPSIWLLQLSHMASINGEEGAAVYNESLPTILDLGVGYQVTVDIPISPERWIQMLEQTLLVVLIMGRWILPKGRISRDHLSQLLLVWLAMGCDIVELFDVLKEPSFVASESNNRLTYIVLACWTVSLAQFPLVLTGKSRKARGGCIRQYEYSFSSLPSVDFDSSKGAQKGFCVLLLSDINLWGLITTTVLQDGPFFALRLYILIDMNIQNYTMVFFTCKNTLILLLQMYRLYVIVTKHHEENRLFKKYMSNCNVCELDKI